MEINIFKGIGDIDFGISKDHFLEMGIPYQEIDLIEEEGEFKIEAAYLDEESTMFFEGNETEMIFTACETANKNALMFGEKIFNKNESQIIDLMKSFKYKDMESEIEEWGEKRVTFNDAMIDFYFDHGKLVNVAWGILVM
jgi:hypothetical protein